MLVLPDLLSLKLGFTNGFRCQWHHTLSVLTPKKAIYANLTNRPGKTNVIPQCQNEFGQQNQQGEYCSARKYPHVLETIGAKK